MRHGLAGSLDDRGHRPGGLSQPSGVDAVVDVGVRVEVVRGTAQQRHAATGVATLVVDAADRHLDHALPELPVVLLGLVPHVLEALVRLEEPVLGPQPDAGDERLVDRPVLVFLGQFRDRGVVRQGAAGAITGPRLLRPAALVAVAARAGWLRRFCGDGPGPVGDTSRGYGPAAGHRSVATVRPVPELPEVESVRRQLAPDLTGRVIDEVWWDDHPEQRFSDVANAAGRRIDDVMRRGKYLLLPLTSELVAEDRAELVLHLGMTGSFRFADAPQHPELDHVRAWFHLSDDRYLLFNDPRRFGRVSVVPFGDHRSIPTLHALGPEPLGEDFTVEQFADDLQRTSATVKAALLGQRLVAGVGNIYADESLWRARIHPLSRRVGRDRAARLHAAVVDVIRGAVQREGTTFRDYQMVNGESGRNADFLDVYGKGGMPCPRCGTELRYTVVAQRGTTYCPKCQRV